MDIPEDNYRGFKHLHSFPMRDYNGDVIDGEDPQNLTDIFKALDEDL